MWRGKGSRAAAILRHRDAPPPVPVRGSIGDNGGPPLDNTPDADGGWAGWVWGKAHRRAWKTRPPEIALRRLTRAEALGLSYRAYTLEILERGRYL